MKHIERVSNHLGEPVPLLHSAFGGRQQAVGEPYKQRYNGVSF